MTEEEIKEKFKSVNQLSEEEQQRLFLMMDAFRESASLTIKGGDTLLKMCDGCAFRKSTDANNNPFTILAAAECVMKHEAFFCHKRFGAGGNEKLCNGWINVMNNK